MTPAIRELPRVDVPDHSAYYPHVSAWMATGQPAREARPDPGSTVALDIEADGLGADAFTIKCVTAAFETGQGTAAIYLDPLRVPDDAEAVRDITRRAGVLVLHNAAYDVPPLYQHGLIDLDAIDKIHDTVVYARMCYSDVSTPKSLEALATGELVEFPAAEMSMAAVFRAAGLTKAEGYRQFDGDRPVYRLGAMSDTIATLRLLVPLQGATWDRLVNSHPFGPRGVDPDGAVALMEREQRVNRIMMRRSAVGLEVDTDYLSRYEQQHARELAKARDDLASAGLDPNAGNVNALLVEKLDAENALPTDWPRTPGGKLRATKADMEKLDGLGHPLAAAVRQVRELDKVTGYLDKVTEMVRVTGRVHPQVGILGASATGRMAYSQPEFQQFPADARPIIVSSTGLTSVDWSQIEPVIMANCAGDEAFLAPFEAGGDLYQAIMDAAGIDRKTAKVTLLAALYGRGIRSLAAQLGVTEDDARRIQTSMFSAMRETERFIGQVRGLAEQYGVMVTASGRILDVPRNPHTGEVFAYKAVNYFCVSPGTPILTADLRHVPANTVRVGDELVGFDEYAKASSGRGSGKRRYRRAVVTDVATIRKECVEVQDEYGNVTVCSADHRWLVRRPGVQPRLQWVEARSLTPDMQLLNLGVWDTSHTRDAGYLAGLYDGEGCMTKRTGTGLATNLVFSQNPGAVLDSFMAAMDREGLTYSHRDASQSSTSPTSTVLVSGMSRMMRTVGTLRPARFIARAHELYDGVALHTDKQLESTPHVRSVTPRGVQEVQSITTTTSTLVANGYLSHNCQGSAYDVLADTLIRVQDAGLADAVHLAMHDELVVDTKAAADIQRIMETPPTFLEKWTGEHKTVFRTDANDMGKVWLYV